MIGSCKGGCWRIVLLKVAYYASSSARNFAELCQNSQITLLISEIMLTNDVASVYIWPRNCLWTVSDMPSTHLTIPCILTEPK